MKKVLVWIGVIGIAVQGVMTGIFNSENTGFGAVGVLCLLAAFLMSRRAKKASRSGSEEPQRETNKKKSRTFICQGCGKEFDKKSLKYAKTDLTGPAIKCCPKCYRLLNENPLDRRS